MGGSIVYIISTKEKRLGNKTTSSRWRLAGIAAPIARLDEPGVLVEQWAGEWELGGRLCLAQKHAGTWAEISKLP